MTSLIKWLLHLGVLVSRVLGSDHLESGTRDSAALIAVRAQHLQAFSLDWGLRWVGNVRSTTILP